MAYYIYKDFTKDKYVVGVYHEKKYTAIHIIREKIKHDEEIIAKELEEQRRAKVIEEFKNSDEYKLILKKSELEERYGVKIKKLVPVTFKVTAYSTLPEENGGYTVTCNGEPLKGNIVANNSIPQFTPILLGDELYRVADRGSSRFNKTNRLDLLIERNYGESIQDYRKRVSDYGVEYIEGYIMYQ